MQQLKPFNTAYFDPATYTGYPEENEWLLIYAPNIDVARFTFYRYFQDLPEYIEPALGIEESWRPKKLNNWWGGYICGKESIQREAGWKFPDDPTCDACGEDWPSDKEGFCGECDSCPECGCVCGEIEKDLEGVSS